MVDPDDEIRAAQNQIKEGADPPPVFYVALISHTTTIAPHGLLDLPPRLKLAGLSGYVQCDTGIAISLDAIEDIDKRRFFESELGAIDAKIRECFERRRKLKGKRR